MSLFPRHLVMGQTLTIHLRLSPSEPCLPLLHLRIQDPAGQTVFESWQQQSTWAPLVQAQPQVPKALVPGIYAVPPLLMVADYLRPEAQTQSTLVGLLQDIGHSRHWYTHWTIPDAALPGKYEVRVSAWLDGHEFPSPTAADDHFFVEHLVVDSLESSADGVAVNVRNHSPEDTKVLIHRPTRKAGSIDGSELSGVVTKVVVAGNATTKLALESVDDIITYAEGCQRLWLNAPEHRPYIRHHACAWAHTQRDAVAIACRRTGKTYVFTDPAKQIWLAADGLTPLSALIAVNAPAVKELLRLGLLVPLDPQALARDSSRRSLSDTYGPQQPDRSVACT